MSVRWRRLLVGGVLDALCGCFGRSTSCVSHTHKHTHTHLLVGGELDALCGYFGQHQLKHRNNLRHLQACEWMNEKSK